MPVKFEIYRDGQRVSQFQPTAAYAVGPESVPIQADIIQRDGMLVVSRPDDVPVGLSLLWESGPAGAYHLETTRLQPRERPYILNVELARLRLMKIVQKQEDWNLFDFPRAEKFMTKFRDTQDLFSESLTKLDDPATAAQLADDSLSRAILLSEELAMFHMELLVNRRRQSNSFVRHIFGCRVDSSVQNQRYREMLAGNFDYAVLPLPWKVLQPQEGVFDTQLIDNWAESLTKKRIPIIAGPLVNFDEADLPDWMFIWENDFDTIRELAYAHVQRLVQRYRKAVSLWNVVAGLATNRAFTLTFEQMIEMTRLLVAQVKNVLPQARTLVTVTQPGNFMRDLFQVSALLDRFSTLGRPVFITAVSAPGRPTPDPADRSEGRL